MSHRRALIVLGCWIAIIIGGCNKGPTVEYGNVQGTLRINGKPQRAVGIQFTPDREKGNGIPAFASGTSDNQGKYTLKYSFKDKVGDGAPVGWQRVVLTDLTVGVTPQGQEPKPSVIPIAYSAATTTPLLVEVKAGDNTINLEVKK
jgi:hypothetical protein